MTISDFTAHYEPLVSGSFWNVDTIEVTSTVSGSYLVEFFNDSGLTNSVFTPFTVTVPYSIWDSSADPSAIGDGLWCRVTNISDPSITAIAQAVV